MQLGLPLNWPEGATIASTNKAATADDGKTIERLIEVAIACIASTHEE